MSFLRRNRATPAARSARASATPAADSAGVTRVDISRGYKFMIYLSFLINLVLILVLLVVGYQLFIRKAGLPPLKGTVSELTDIIDKLQNATIVASVPLNEQLPINLQVPVSQATNVRVTQSVPLNVPAAIVFPGGGGNLNASVSLNLPEGLELPVFLSMTIPLESSVPVSLTVPVEIPLRETELGPQFGRLRELVQPLEDLVQGQARER